MGSYVASSSSKEPYPQSSHGGAVRDGGGADAAGGGSGGGGVYKPSARNNGGGSEPNSQSNGAWTKLAGTGGNSDRPADLAPGPEWAPFVSIHPPEIEFGKRPLCSLSTSHFTLFNTHPKESLRVISLTTDSVPFQPLDFEQMDVAPEGQLNIAITYLPRSLGTTQGTVMLLTSKAGPHTRPFFSSS